jgi:hypothetical protein
MLEIVARNGLLEIHDRMSPGIRGLYVAIGLIPLLAPYQLLIQPHWQGFLNLPFLFAAIISAGALAVSSLFFWAAIAGLDRRASFDGVARCLTYSAGAPAVRLRQEVVPFDRIRGVEIVTHDWSEGSPSYSLRVEIDGGGEYDLGSSWSRAEVEKAGRRIAGLVGVELAG